MKVLFLCPIDPLWFKDELQFASEPPKIFGPWIINTIKLLNQEDSLELFVVAEFGNLLSDTNFTKDGVHYFFLSQRVPFFKRGYPHIFKHYTNYFLLNRKVKRIIRKIKPDIVNLHGTEHDLSSCILSIKNIPKLVTIQGFVHLALKYESRPNSFLEHKAALEYKIFNRETNFGIRGEYMKLIINHHNLKAVFHQYDYPTDMLKMIQPFDKKRITDYDIVFFGRINKIKGIEDLLDALHILKSRNYNLTLHIIGPCAVEYKIFLLKKIEKLKLSNTVLFIGEILERTNFLSEIKKAKIYVLPVYEDVIPGTIIEAIALGVPVISYETGAIPDINHNKPSVIIVPQGDLEKLSESILHLLSDQGLQQSLIENAQEWLKDRVADEKIKNRIINIYTDILSNTNNFSTRVKIQ